MTEAEWMACDDPTPMIGLVRGRAGDRRHRLLAAAACRRVWGQLDDERSRRGVEVAETFADGGITDAELDEALSKAHQAYEDATRRDSGGPAFVARCRFADAVVSATQPRAERDSFTGRVSEYDGWRALSKIAGALAVLRPSCAVERNPYLEHELLLESGEQYAEPLSLDEQTAQAAIIRDIFGPKPLTVLAFSPAWRTDTAVSLARQMYEGRDFSAMPILADALQDAGCDSEDILSHCRGPGPHVRGCWVVDLVLGKE